MTTDARIDGYASAVIEIARAEGQLDRVGDELFRIARAVESSNELREALTDRRLPTERKQAVVDDLIGDQASPLSVSLVSFVIGAGRAGELPDIADRVATRAAAERDHVIGEVRSATALDDATMARLAAALSTATGKQVEVKTVIDPDVVGGIVARIGDTVIDGSVQHRMEELRDALLRR